MTVAAIQSFLAGRSSFLAKFYFVGSTAGFVDSNGNGKFDSGEPSYIKSGSLKAGTTGTSAASVISSIAIAHGVNPKVLLATAEKEASLISRITMPTYPPPTSQSVNLDFVMGCGSATNFRDQFDCAATFLVSHSNDRADRFGQPITYPYFFATNAGIQHDDGSGRKPVTFAVSNGAAYTQYRYTPFIQASPTGGGVYLFESAWRKFGF
jgi:hypothetical protein